MSQVIDPSEAKRRPAKRAPDKRARLYARLTPAQKDLLQRAADLAERNLSEFVVTEATERAVQIIRERQSIELSARDSEVFAAAMLSPSPPNDALRRAAELHDKLVSS